MNEELKPRDLPMAPWKKTVMVISSMVVALPAVGTMAYNLADYFIDKAYVTHVELDDHNQKIINSIRNIEVRAIREKIFTIDDLEIDGKLTSAHKKKRIRLESDLKALNGAQ